MNIITDSLPEVGQVVSMILVDVNQQPVTSNGMVDMHDVVYIYSVQHHGFRRLRDEFRLVGWFELPEGLSNLPAIKESFEVIPF